jgi:hypothetical protein
LELEPIGGRHVPVLGHDTLDDLASMLVRDDYDDRDDLMPMLMRGDRGDHDDLAPVLVCGGHDDHDDLAPVHGQHHRGHDHENPMATQMLGHDEGSERLHGDEGQEHRPVHDGRTVP